MRILSKNEVIFFTFSFPVKIVLVVGEKSK